MSNYLAIATVTETLKYVLNYYVGQDVPGAVATAVLPTSNNPNLPTHGVNIALYQLMPNPAARNLDTPTRSSDGTQTQRPRAAIDLHYIFSVYGTDADLEPHRIMGSVVRTLHTYPTLSRNVINEAVAGATFLNGTGTSKTASDLSTDIELVKLVPLALTLDELSRVWSVYFQTNYALSVVYQASVVYLEDTSSPQVALPVRVPQIVTTPISVPVITNVSPQPATFGAVLTITGPNVGVGGPNVIIGDAPWAQATVVNANQITYQLPNTTPAGVSALSVVQLVNFGTSGSPELRPGTVSQFVPMALAPTIQTITPNPVARNSALTVTFDTPVASTTDVSLLLDSEAIPLPMRPASNLPVNSFSFTVPGDVVPGPRLVRLRVGGVESALTVDSTGKYTQPTVTVT